MIFFYYCFYRISNVYKVLDQKDFDIFAMGVISLCQSFNLLTFIAIPFILTKIQYDTEIIATIVIIVIFVNWSFILTKKKYNELSERFQHENPKYKKLKGWLIVLYVLTSLVTYMIALSIMNAPVRAGIL